MAFFIICMIIEIPAMLFFGFGSIFLWANDEKSNFWIIFWLFIASIGLFVTSLTMLIRRKKGAANTILSSILLKATIVLAAFTYATLASKIENGIYAAVFFGFLGVVTGVLAMVSLATTDGAVKKAPAATVNTPFFTAYKSKWAWDDAAAEYARISGKSMDHIRYYDNELVYAYASMPIIYYLTWLIDRNYMSPQFYAAQGLDGGAYIDGIKNRQVSPLEFFCRKMDYVLAREDIAEELRTFTDYYVEGYGVHRYGNESELFMFDYYEAVRNSAGTYYCVELSWNTYDRLAAILDKKWKNWQTAAADPVFPSEESAVKQVHSVYWNRELNLTLIGNVTEEYVRKCEKCLNEMKESEFALDGLEGFMPDEMLVFEPQGAEAAFCILGESETEKEHGLSLIIRNGIVTDTPGYRIDYENPWGEKQEDNYRRAVSDERVSVIKNEEEAAKAFEEGLLTSVFVEAKGRVYLTYLAAEKKNKAEARVELLEILGLADRHEIRPLYEGDNPVPKRIDIAAYMNDVAVFSGQIEVWRRKTAKI